jgi:hypothetical protein
MAYPKEITFDAVRTLAFGGISGVFAAIGTALTEPARIIKIQNTTNQSIEFSLDGVTIHDVIPSNAFALYDLTANKTRDEGIYIREGTIFYIRRPAAEANPTSGNVYVTVLRGA